MRLHPCEHTDFCARCIVRLPTGQCPLCRAAITYVDLSNTVSRHIRDIEVVSEMVDQNDKRKALQVLVLGNAKSQKVELVRSLVREEVRRNPNHGKDGLFGRPFLANATIRQHDICFKVFECNAPVSETLRDDLRSYDTDLVIVCVHQSEVHTADIFRRWKETIEVANPGATAYFVTQNIGADIVPELRDIEEEDLFTGHHFRNQERPLLLMKENLDGFDLRKISHAIALAAAEGRRRVRVRRLGQPPSGSVQQVIYIRRS